MNKFDQITVIQFMNGKTVETFEKDEDIRTGRKTNELAGKTRIVWDADGSYEWVNSDVLVKLDNRHLQYVPVVLPSPDNQHASVEMIEAALNSDN